MPYKAQWTLWNAEQGSFPNANKAVPIEKPFGAKLHKEYLEATGRRIDTTSPWHEWLHSEYHADLVYRVKQKNQLLGMSSVNPRMLTLIPKFIAGETDQLT